MFPFDIIQSYAVDMWLRGGTPREKLIVGMPTYGRSFTLMDQTQTHIGAPASGAGINGTYTREHGFLAYYEVTKMISKLSCKSLFFKERDIDLDHPLTIPLNTTFVNVEH